MTSFESELLAPAQIRLSLMVAMANNRCIGLDNRLPWHLPNDLKRFKETTLGKPVIMGRKTFDSIGRPLPRRPNIVISRNTKWRPTGFEDSLDVITVNSVQQAIAKAQQLADELQVDEIVVIGGAQIYAELLPQVDRLYITAVNTNVAGDAFFPEFDAKIWRMTKNETCDSDDCHKYGFVFQQWDRQI